jgi:1-acyl-sn-glycerol-3-phosphate acyltransferase
MHKVASFFGVITIFLGLVFLSSKLNFEEDITKLIPENEKAVTLNKVLDQVDFADKIVVHITANDGNITDLTQAATELNKELRETCSTYISEIQGVVNDDDLEETLDFVYNNLPLFLTKEDYKEIEHKITIEEIKKATASNYKSLISPSGFVTRNTILKDPFGLTFLGLQKLKELQVGDGFTIENGFVVTQDKQDLLLFIKPKLAPNETDKNTEFVALLNQIKSSLNSQYINKVSVNYYGATIVAVANANQIKKDIQLTVSIALSILFIILMLFYKRLSIPVILFIPTVFGALLAISVLYLFRGTISAISIGIGSVLLGITLDFSLHILTHYRSNVNVKQLYDDVTKPIVMSSITTAMAFLCLLFIKSRALQDLGVFAAVSVLGSSFFALILIPHLYKEVKVKTSKKNIIDKVASYGFSKNKIIIVVSLLLCVLTAFTYYEVQFDKDISKMNYQTKELLQEEKVLGNLLNSSSKSLYIVAYSSNLNNALQENETIYKTLKKLKENKTIVSYSSSASVILSDKQQKNKIQNWQNFWTVDKQKFIKESLVNEGATFGFKPTTFNKFYDKISDKPAIITLEDYSLISALNAKEFISGSNNFYTVLSTIKVSEGNLEEVKRLFASRNTNIVIDRQAMNETFLSSFKDNFNTLLGYSFLAVIIVLLLFFKRIELVCITIIPIILTWMITIGLMGIFGLSFNIFNIIISTFIFGLGVDYAIFMTNGLIKEYETGDSHLPVYKTSIILSVVTTILGVGVLIFAKHPALYSIALVCLIGINVALLMTFVIQPIVFRAVITNRAKNGLAPLELRKTLHSLFSFTLYGLGGMLLSLFAITVLKVIPVNKKAKFKWLHNTMATLASSVLYTNPFVNKNVLLNKETFEKQAIIIANHTSFLDTLAIALVTPKVIFLVNDWVYKSPIFGQLAKVAGYYPVSSGVDGSLEHLKEKMKQGYSLVVFPEGKRMFSNKIGRFHKGAFFLAQELGLDILPMYIHGNSEVLPKGDFIIYDGSITVKMGDRIAINNPELGISVKQKTKNISTLFKTNFQKIRKEIEGDNYFKKLVLSNYVYKSTTIVSAINFDLKNNLKTYVQASKLIALDAKILHVGDDYGQIDLLLNYYSNSRQIYTYVSDETKRKLAKNNFIGKDRNITYLNNLQLSESVNTLLLTTKTKLITLELKHVSTIVILNKCMDLGQFLDIGFTVDFHDNTIHVLKK